MTFDEFEESVGRTWDDSKPWTLQVLHALSGLAGETGEVAENIKKGIFHERYDLMTPDRMQVELGDVEYYATQLERLFGLKKEQVCQANAEKLAARYPDGFVEGGGVR